MSEREQRGNPQPVEIRAGDNGEIRIEGYAAVFNQDADIAGMFVERIAPGAFASAVGRDDVVLLVNHDDLPLARTRSGTLMLREDAQGLHVAATLDGTDPDVQRVYPKMKRGDLDKMSFAFRAVRQEWDESANPPRRTILEAELYDVSIVTTPAYEGTSVALRSLDARRRQKNFNAAAARIRNRNKIALSRSGRAPAQAE